jgi:hypothetical protein
LRLCWYKSYFNISNIIFERIGIFLTSFFSDSVAAYEQIGIDANEEEEKQADGQINNFLDKLDHNGQMEVAHG